ncbi:MSMEG_0565 family glycosyltransferase [Rhodococcus aerolatus]
MAALAGPVALLTYSTRPRGGVVHTLALAEALAARGEDVTVWSIGRDGDAGFFRPVDPRVTLRVVGVPDRDGEDFADRIVRSIDALGAAFAARTERYAVVHAQDCLSFTAAARSHDDVLRTVHHLDRFTTPVLARCHERAVVEPAGHVCVSAAVAAELHAGWGITATVIPNGVDAARFVAAAADEPAAAAARDRWRGELGDYVLAVGGIEPRKGTADLVEAVARVPGGRRLVVAGGSTVFDHRGYRDAVLARAAELGVDLVLLGPVDHAALPSLVAAARVFAFPSVQEGFGLAALEALAAGVPVVCRDLPVLREVLGDTVDRAADVPALAAALAAPSVAPGRGRDLALGYTWDAAAAAHLALYRGRDRVGARGGSAPTRGR